MSDLGSAAPFPQARILVADDEREVRSVLVRFLNLLGYRADEAACGSEALEMLARTPYDVAVLDIRMPEMDGIEVMRRTHQVRPDLAVIFLTGHGSLESAIAAVKGHAADYLIKPVSNRDLAVAVASALQRRAQGGRRWSHAAERFVQAGPVTLDQERRCAIVTHTTGDFRVELTASETALLAYLMQRPGIAVSCRELAWAALAYDVSDGEARSLIRPHIARLRKKIRPEPAHPRLIHTVSGVGYSFIP
jgi:two-component system KDP operon response regulator KdpE